VGDQHGAGRHRAADAARFTFTPDLYVQYFRDLHDMIAAGKPFTPQATVEVMARYATVPATDYGD
jgi:hypothetical protein